MKGWVAGLSIAAGLWCGPLRAQQVFQCSGSTPPEHQLDRNGNVLPEARDWDPDAECMAVNSRRVSSGVISAQALAHKPGKAARKEFDQGVQAWGKGQNAAALRHLAEAARLDPGFAEAQIELGAVYTDVGQPAVALECFNRALSLEPNSAPANTAKAASLVTLNRADEAEPVARRALQLDPSSTAAHYMLGVALVMQEKLTPEAAVHLKAAAHKYPRAAAYLAELEADLANKPAR